MDPLINEHIIMNTKELAAPLNNLKIILYQEIGTKKGSLYPTNDPSVTFEVVSSVHLTVTIKNEKFYVEYHPNSENSFFTVAKVINGCNSSMRPLTHDETVAYFKHQKTICL